MSCLLYGRISYVVSSTCYPHTDLQKNKNWSFWWLGITVLILVLTLIGFTIYINSGAIYETKTIGVLPFRITITLVFLALAYFNINKKL